MAKLFISFLTFTVALASCGGVLAFSSSSPAGSPRDPFPPAMLMPWFCTTACGYNMSQIMDHVHQAVDLATHDASILNTVAYEWYSLGPNSTLVVDLGMFDLNYHILKNDTLTALFPRRFALVSTNSSSTHQFIEWMRQLFETPEPFVSAVVDDVVARNITGLNIDFEPTSNNITNEDAANFATFLNLLRQRLEVHNKVLTIAGATWSPIWNLTLIAQALSGSEDSNVNSTIGYFTSMNTYAKKDEAFQRELNRNIEQFGTYGSLKSLVVGLETWPTKITPEELDNHFELLAQHNVCRIAIWDMPLTPAMLPHLKNLSHRCTHKE
ncbi:membrane-associated protein, putative [Bodo saltans]|uniref:Membrane-associated protein, putative n=1 Tax=Bodo saltans TaxID=75058 RepID=A0A0S4JVW2_BODSA|nr:membrane-associated protein, putative [Bodo saltans]|eukprot:CUG94371.1 membrane-associated protein, putative [Bodo saltans]